MEEPSKRENIPYYPKILVIIDKANNAEFATILRIQKGGVWYEKEVITKYGDLYKSPCDWDFYAVCYKMLLLGENLIENGDEPAEDQRSELRRLAEEEEVRDREIKAAGDNPNHHYFTIYLRKDHLIKSFGRKEKENGK